MMQSSKNRLDVQDLLLHPFITAAMPPAREPAAATTAIETYPRTFKLSTAEVKLPRHPGVVVSSFAIEAARRQQVVPSALSHKLPFVDRRHGSVSMCKLWLDFLDFPRSAERKLGRCLQWSSHVRFYELRMEPFSSERR